VTENPLALRSIYTLGVRHRRDAYATLDARSIQIVKSTIKLQYGLNCEMTPAFRPGFQ
jgi:hypothetical protein